MTKVVDENKMIVKPVAYGRSSMEYNVGDVGEFMSNGWIIKGEVQSVRMFYDDRFISSDCMYVYHVCKYEKLEFLGLERTDDEEVEYQKELDRQRQLKLKL